MDPSGSPGGRQEGGHGPVEEPSIRYTDGKPAKEKKRQSPSFMPGFLVGCKNEKCMLLTRLMTTATFLADNRAGLLGLAASMAGGHQCLRSRMKNKTANLQKANLQMRKAYTKRGHLF